MPGLGAGIAETLEVLLWNAGCKLILASAVTKYTPQAKCEHMEAFLKQQVILSLRNKLRSFFFAVGLSEER